MHEEQSSYRLCVAASAVPAACASDQAAATEPKTTHIKFQNISKQNMRSAAAALHSCSSTATHYSLTRPAGCYKTVTRFRLPVSSQPVTQFWCCAGIAASCPKTHVSLTSVSATQRYTLPTSGQLHASADSCRHESAPSTMHQEDSYKLQLANPYAALNPQKLPHPSNNATSTIPPMLTPNHL